MLKPEKKSFNIGYLLWRFPVISETFILDEMYFLRKQFPMMGFLLYSIKKSHDSQYHKQVAGFIHSDLYIPNLLSPKFMLSILIFVISRPFLLISVFWQLIRETPVQITLKLSIYYIFQSGYCFLKGIYLAGELKKRGIQHIHTHYAESSGLISCIASKISGIPYSLTLHGHDIYDNKNSNLIVFLIRNSSFSTTVSEFNRNYILQMDSKIAQKIIVVHCGISLDTFKKQQYKKNEKPIILVVARLVKTKGIDDLINACFDLNGQINYECIIIGDGPERNYLEQLIISLKISNRMKMLGYASRDVILQHLNKASVLVLPTYTEGIPISLMEAMAMQVPIISTNIKGIPELVKDGAGILLEPGNIKQLEDAILAVVKLSEKKRQNMGLKARAIIENEFDIRKQVKVLYQKFVLAGKF